jgi:hypothetical protein
MSRRYGGIHFARADMVGRTLGRVVADRSWVKAQSYFDGTNSSPAPTLDVALAPTATILTEYNATVHLPSQ